MPDEAEEFTPIEGQNVVTVPAGKVEFPKIIGVRGQMMVAVQLSVGASCIAA